MMHTSSVALLLLTSLVTAVPSAGNVVAHQHHRLHKADHHKRGSEDVQARDIYTKWETVNEVQHVTVTVNPPTQQTPAAAVDQSGSSSNSDAAAAAADQDRVPAQAADSTEEAATVGSDDSTQAASSDDETTSARPDSAGSAPQMSNQRLSTSARRYPFSRVVAFGDSMTDNGNGSYDHCVQAGAGQCNNKIYGHGTWTDGPVAVSYLVDKLNVPLAEDYAWGWAHGGGAGDNMAATIKQTYTAAPDVKSGYQQVQEYLASSDPNIKDTLAFLWIGNMDITMPKFTYPDSSEWSSDMSNMISHLVGELIDAGAPYVFVPGLYAKQIAPFHSFMASEPLQQKQMGQAIQEANEAIKSELESKYGNKVIYYNVFDRMMDIWNNHGAYGIDKVGDNFCDGDTKHPDNFDVCLMQGQGDRWYWINFTDFTSHVHSLIADDMFSTIKRRFSS